MIKCSMCNSQYKDRRTFAYHVSRTHKNVFLNELEKELYITHTIFGKDYVNSIVQDYINEKYCIYDLPIDLSKLLLLMGVKRTSKQERSTDRYKENYLKSIQKKYGDNITNISQSEQVKTKVKNTISQKYGYKNYYNVQLNLMQQGYNNYLHTEKHREAILKSNQTCLEKYGHQNFGLGKDAIEKRKTSLKETISKLSYEERLERTSKARESVNHRGGYSSKPEKRIRKCLIDLDVVYQPNKHLLNYNWDIVIDKIIIEVQGVMWHAKPDKYKENDLIMGKILAKDIWKKDYRKRKKALNEGYSVIEIWEDEITGKSDEELCKLVKQKLIENGYKFYD